MTRITARGKIVDNEDLGVVMIVVEGDHRKIHNVSCKSLQMSGEEDPSVRELFAEAMEDGPHYPLFAMPNTMLCAQCVLHEMFVDSANTVKTTGPIETPATEDVPDAVY